MANTKKANTENSESQELKQENNINESYEVIDLKKQVEILQEQIKMFLQMQNNNLQQSQKSDSDINRWIKIIHLQDMSDGLTTHIKLSTRDLDFTFFGEERLVRYTEFEEMTGKYKHYFRDNIIALSSEDNDLVNKYHLPCAEEIEMKSSHLRNITNLSIDELENLYNKVADNHKKLIIHKFAHGYYERDEKGNYPKDHSFNDRRKIDLLNELSGGALQNVLMDIDQRRKNKS
jgi:hypothetical protein